MKLIHIKGNLFTGADATDSLAHCISKDAVMGAGIAMEFKARFERVDETKCVLGEAVVLQAPDRRFVYNLVTKEVYHNKPDYKTLSSCLDSMCKHALHNGVTCIAMPRIGCGLDRLQWSQVEALIRMAFANTSILIKVYSL